MSRKVPVERLRALTTIENEKSPTNPVWAVLLGFVALSALVVGCQPQRLDEPGEAGRLQLRLLAEAESGASYRLRDAVIMVQGPTLTLFFDTNDAPKAQSFTAEVPVGQYAAFLQEGWTLERTSGAPLGDVAGAELLSSNPLWFTVERDETTAVAIRFGVDLRGSDHHGEFDLSVDVREHDLPPGICSTDEECAHGETCCVTGFLGSCMALSGDECPLPDLTVSEAAVRRTLSVYKETFPSNSCAIAEGCVNGSGERRLLGFSVETPNVGEADIVLGTPDASSGFEWGACHGHYHFTGYAEYELVDEAGEVAARGHKQAFCLLDSFQLDPEASSSVRFHCGFQGIQSGWVDSYDSTLDCQWVDITGVAAGEYLLRVTVNSERRIEEANYDNNLAEVLVTIEEDLPDDPLRPCQGRETGVYRDCGWEFGHLARGLSCEPGADVTVGCACGHGVCSGDAVLRVCEGDQACAAESLLGLGDDACGICPDSTFRCPESGVFSVLVGAYDSTQPYSCDPVVVE